MEMKID